MLLPGALCAQYAIVLKLPVVARVELCHYLIEEQISQSREKISLSGKLKMYNSKNSTLERVVNSLGGNQAPPHPQTMCRLDIQSDTIKDGVIGRDNDCLSL